MILLILSACLVSTMALPSYIAVPADQIAFVDLTDLRLRRVPRQTLSPPPPSHPVRPLIFDPQPYQPYTQQAIAPTQDVRPLEAQPQLLRLNQDTSGSATHGESHYAPERPADFGEFVDFGAHTGDNGAFGWYADYPINNDGDSYRK